MDFLPVLRSLNSDCYLLLSLWWMWYLLICALRIRLLRCVRWRADGLEAQEMRFVALKTSLWERKIMLSERSEAFRDAKRNVKRNIDFLFFRFGWDGRSFALRQMHLSCSLRAWHSIFSVEGTLMLNRHVNRVPARLRMYHWCEHHENRTLVLHAPVSPEIDELVLVLLRSYPSATNLHINEKQWTARNITSCPKSELQT